MRRTSAVALLFRAVLHPRRTARDEGLGLIKGWGPLLVALRWFACSVILALRDYGTLQPPLVPPPFGLEPWEYRLLEIYTAPLFGALLFAALTLALWGYLKWRKRYTPGMRILDALGVAFFVPWLIVSVADLAVIHLGLWTSAVVAPLHTAVLGWESRAAVELVGGRTGLKTVDKVVASLLLMLVWITLCVVWWR
jgi:hypothetical protein